MSINNVVVAPRAKTRGAHTGRSSVDVIHMSIGVGQHLCDLMSTVTGL